MKRIRILFCVVTVLFFLINCFGQEIDEATFLQDYRPPDYTFTALSLFPELFQSYSSTSTFDRSRFRIGSSVSYQTNSMLGKNNTNTNLFGGLTYSFAKNNDLLVPNDNFIGLNAFFFSDRYHYVSEPFFLKASFEGSSNLNLFTELEDDGFVYSNDWSVPLGIGVGRPMDVTDAWHSLSFNDELKKRGIDPSIEDQKSFADFIYNTKRTRVKDFRYDRIFELEQLYSFLAENSDLTLSPIQSAVLADIWQYEAFQRRLSGYRATFSLRPGYNFGRLEASNSYSVWYLGGELDLEYFRPINKHWQFNIQLLTQYNSFIRTDQFPWRIFLRPNVNYFISSRTFLTIRIDQSIQQQKIILQNESFYSSQVTVEFSHFFNPSLVFNIRFFTGRYQREDFDPTWDESFNFGIIYRIL